jgi:uncharacterized integral membrane protein
MRTRQLWIAPLLTPLLAVLVVAAFNPSPRVSFRLLTWVTPKAPLGIWLASAALGGAALSGSAAGLTLRQMAARKTRRGISPANAETWAPRRSRGGSWPRGGDERKPAWREDMHPEHPESPWMEQTAEVRREARRNVAPARAPGDPAPTVVVPFRVLRRPSSSAADDVFPASPAGWAPPATARAASARDPVPVAATDDWGDGGGEEW